jgi:hypothetical protein
MMDNEKKKNEKCFRGLPVRNHPVETLPTDESGHGFAILSPIGRVSKKQVVARWQK